MKKIDRMLLMIVALFGVVSLAHAQITTPAIISDNMVLKRNSIAKIWGWAKSTEKVYIVADWNIEDTVRVVCGTDTRFEAQIKTPEAGGPYTIKIVGSRDRKEISNVMVGEVWLCSGQSNMQMSTITNYGTKLDYGDEMSRVYNSNIRTFRVPLKASDYPQDDCKSSWSELSSSSVSDVSLTAYFFAQRLEKELGIPVGIVMSSWGGTIAEVWIPEEMGLKSEDVTKSIELITPSAWWPTKVSSLYNAMIAPLVPFSFSGAIWYQGESNIVSYNYYDGVMRTLIDSWREKFGADMPFYYVQIAPFAYKNGKLNGSAYLREQQTITSSHKGVGMVVINDIIDDVNNIHPKNKLDVGYRLADMALAKSYGKSGYSCHYPAIKSVTPSGKKLILDVENSASALQQVAGEGSGFKVAGADGSFVDAMATIIDANTIEVSAKEVKEPIYLRYLFDDTSLCGIKSSDGLPMIPYRNDMIE